MLLLDDILLAPIKGVMWIGQKFHEVAGADVSDRDALRKKLLEIQLLYEMDEISEEEYELKEREILDLLEAADRDDELEES
ncbi:MAG: gas vesicle protein GvpG [Planctomycetes bacterium]|nr:gas vesicle protein GvpG [Planctomycetota bacterium]